MTETEKSELIIYPAVRQFFTNYLSERDAGKTMAMCADDLYSLGTGLHEVARNKKEFEALVREEIRQVNRPIRFDMKRYTEKMLAPGNFLCMSDMEISVPLEEGGAITMETRLTAGFRERDGRYLAWLFHMSQASVIQEEREFFPLRYGLEVIKKLNQNSQAELIELMKEVIPGGVLGKYVEEGFPLYVVNDELLHLIGYTYEEFQKKSEKSTIQFIHPEDRERVSGELMNISEYGFNLEYRMQKKDGSYIWIHEVGRKIKTDDGKKAVISILSDVSESVNLKNRFREEAARDSLTGIYNRRAAAKMIDSYLQNGRSYGFLILDIDEFKSINDLFGHQKGDHVLICLAGILKDSFRPTDICARLGGDEFVIFMPGAPSEKFIYNMAEKISAAFKAEQMKINGIDHRTGISIGGIYGEQVTKFDHIYPIADMLLYDVKRNRKGGISIMKYTGD